MPESVPARASSPGSFCRRGAQLSWAPVDWMTRTTWIPQRCSGAEGNLRLLSGMRSSTSYPSGVRRPRESKMKSGLNEVLPRPSA